MSSTTVRSLALSALVLLVAGHVAAETPSTKLRAILGDSPGAIVVHDLVTDDWHVSDPAAVDARYAPFSSFKIWNTIFALDSGAAPGLDHEIAWDPALYPRDKLRNDSLAAPQTLESAFRRSIAWYYRETAKRIGTERMQAYVDRAQYGNRDISGGVDRFWLSSSLAISPREQVERLGVLLTDGLGFSERAIGLMSELAYAETVDGCSIHGKTGTGPADPDAEPWYWHGWYVGWRDCGDDDLVTFAVFLEADTYAELRDRRYALAKRALERLELLPRRPVRE